MSPAGVDLVTGGAGFIGSALVELLVADGRRVRVLDNLFAGRLENLASIPHQQLDIVVGDVRDADIVQRATIGCERIFHLAALGVRRSIFDPWPVHEVNAAAALLMVETARKVGVRRLVHISSSEVYGSAKVAPMDEGHPTEPTTAYGASKLAGEAYARAGFLTHGLDIVIVRPFNTYGPRCHHEGEGGEVIPRFLLRALAGEPLVIFGDGHQSRDFTYVYDMAMGIKAAAQQLNSGETINLGSGRDHSILQLAEAIIDITGSMSKIKFDGKRPGDVQRLLANADKAETLLNWRANVDLRSGLGALIDWYNDGGQSPEELLAHEVLRNWEL